MECGGALAEECGVARGDGGSVADDGSAERGGAPGGGGHRASAPPGARWLGDDGGDETAGRSPGRMPPGRREPMPRKV